MNDPGLGQGFIVWVGLCIVGWVLLFTRSGRQEHTGQEMAMFLAAMVVRFAISIVVYQLGLVSVLGDADSSGWIRGARLQQQWAAQGVTLFGLPSVLSQAFSGDQYGYYYLLGAFFLVTSLPFRLVGAALNCFFGSVTVVLVCRTARLLFGPEAARRVGWWTCLFPSMVIWSAQTVKEPVVMMLLSVAMYSCVYLRERGLSVGLIVLSAVSMVLLLPFRFYAAYIAAATTGLSFLSPSKKGARRAAVGLVLFGALVFIGVRSGANSIYQERVQGFSLDQAQGFRTAVAVGRQGTGSGVVTDDIRTPKGLAKGVAIGGAHLLLAPFPWELGGASLRMLLTLPELVIWWWLFFVGVVPGFAYSLRRRFDSVYPMLLFLLGFGTLYALMFGNIGLVVRQRAQLLPWLFVLAGVGIEQRRLRRAERDAALFAVEIPR